MSHDFYISESKWAKCDSGLLVNSYGVSYSKSLPSPNTAILSDFIIVLSLCATVITVES